MKKYLIYTTNSTEPFVVETEVDLIDRFTHIVLEEYPVMRIRHTKNLVGLGAYNYDVVLNVNNIVSITTSEKD